MGGSRGVLRVEGGPLLRATLKAAGGEITDLKAAHREVSDVVVAAVKADPPYDPVTPDGVHIATTVRVAATKTAASVRAGNNTKVTYGPTLHYGDSRPTHPRSSADPFLWNAAQRTESVWLPIYAKHVDQVVDQIRGA